MHRLLAHTTTGDGPPVVLIHAGVTDHHLWDAVTPTLAATHTVIRYDLRGFGESAPPTAPFRETDDLAHLLDHLGHDRVHVVGASWGGRIALDFTLAHPTRVRSLTLLAAPWPGHDWSPEMIEYDATETAALEAGDLDTAVRLNLDMWLRGPARSWSEVGEGLADQLRDPLRTLLTNQGVVGEHSQGPGRKDPAGITVPTLVGVGKLDVPDFREIARRYADVIPGAEFVEFEGAAHLIAMDVPGQVGLVLGEFLKGHAVPRD